MELFNYSVSKFTRIILLTWCFFMLPVSMEAANYNRVVVILSNDSPLYHQFYNSLTSKLGDGYDVDFIYSRNINDSITNKANLVVSVGLNSFNAILLRKISAPVIYTLTSDTVFKNNSGYCPSSQCYAITIEQPTERYVSLIHQLFGKVKTINYISSNITSDDRIQAIRQQAAKYGIKTRVTEHKASPDNFNFNIELDDNDVLLALPDPLIYNRHTAKNIILSAYHNNASIVAYSAAFTKSGALASLYSSIDDIAESTYNTTLKVLSGKQLNSKIIRPEHFSVLTNKAVARSMGLTLKNEEQLKESIK